MYKDLLLKGTPAQGTKVFSSLYSVDIPLVRRKDGDSNNLRWLNHKAQRLAEQYTPIYRVFLEQALDTMEAQAWAREELLFPQGPILCSTGLELQYPVPFMLIDQASVVPADVFEFWNDTSYRVKVESRLPDEHVGSVVGLLYRCNGVLLDRGVDVGAAGWSNVQYLGPTRGVSEFKGDIEGREKGSLIVFADGTMTSSGLVGAQDRGKLFANPGDDVDKGMIIGIHQGPGDLEDARSERTLVYGAVVVGALNVDVFGTLEKEFHRDPFLYHITLNEVYLFTNDYYVRERQAFPFLVYVHDESWGYAVYASYGYKDEEPVVTAEVTGTESEVTKPRNPRLVCQLCNKVGHTARTCYASFGNPETVKRLVEANAPRGRGSRGRSYLSRRTGRGAGVSSVSTGNLSADPALLDDGTVYEANLVRDSSMACGASVGEGDKGVSDFEYDDYANVHILCDIDAMELFETSESTGPGFAMGIRVTACVRGPMILDMGLGVYAKEANVNLLSAVQLRKTYQSRSIAVLVYVHKRNGATIIFKFGGDGYYHTKLVRVKGHHGVVAPSSVSATDRAVIRVGELGASTSLEETGSLIMGERQMEVTSGKVVGGDIVMDVEVCLQDWCPRRGIRIGMSQASRHVLGMHGVQGSFYSVAKKPVGDRPITYLQNLAATFKC
jgi:hypothetical protein